jgi:hypothetical protein
MGAQLPNLSAFHKRSKVFRFDEHMPAGLKAPDFIDGKPVADRGDRNSDAFGSFGNSEILGHSGTSLEAPALLPAEIVYVADAEAIGLSRPSDITPLRRPEPFGRFMCGWWLLASLTDLSSWRWR